MSVEYSASTVTKMDMDSKIGYKQFFEDGSKLKYSVFVVRTNPFRAATVCLALLSVILLAGVIGQHVHYQNVAQDHQKNITAMLKEKASLQEDLKKVQKDKKDIQVVRNTLEQTNTYLSKRNQQLQVNNKILNQETNTLKISQSQLQTSNTALNKTVATLTADQDTFKFNNNALTVAKDLLQKKYDSAVKQKNELQANFNSVVKDRDNLENRYNNVTRSKELLQMNYNNLIRDVEHLETRFNHSSTEKDKIASSHQNLTIEKDSLQAIHNVLVNATEKLRASCTSLVQEKSALENSCRNVTVERDLLMKQNENLTAERDQLQLEVERLNATVQARKCPSGWKKFQNRCYYLSNGKKTWRASRDYCQTKLADLAILKTAEEMTFINGLFGTDKEVWIGLTDDGVEGEWKWIDGTRVTTPYWGKDQPNSYDGRNQDCVEVWHRDGGTGDWNDEHCNVEQNWVCQM